MGAKLAGFTIKGQKFDVQVNDDGKFWSSFDGASISDVTLGALKAKALRLINNRSVKVAVPFTYIEDDKVKEDVATGIHSANNNILAKELGQVRRWRHNEFMEFMRALSPSERAGLLKLLKQRRDAEKSIERLTKEYAIDLDEAVKAEIAKALKEK